MIYYYYKEENNTITNEKEGKIIMKTVIYKENGVYKTTTEENYKRTIRNAREIHNMYDFESAEEIMDYYMKWFKCNKEDFIVIE